MFTSETEFENHIRKIIFNEIISKNSELILLKEKDVVDILICKNSSPSKLYFLEAKFHTFKKNRIGFGSQKGKGFQTEILSTRPNYFNENMRWIFGTETNSNYYILSNEEASEFICGGFIGEKQNNFQTRIFTDFQGLTEMELISYLKKWLQI